MPLLSRYQVKHTTTPDVAARILSDVLNPLAIPSFVITIIGFAEQASFENLLVLVAIALLFYTLMPASFAVGITYYRPAESLDFYRRGSRTPLYAFSILSILAGAALITTHFDSRHINLAAIIFVINLVVGFVVNLKWKISVHSGAVATGGLYLLLYGLASTSASGTLITGIVLLGSVLPLVIWSRYQLRVHSPAELFGGAITGLILTGGVFLLAQV